MKVLLCLCFILFVSGNVIGQTENPNCGTVRDFEPCLTDWECNTNVSKCNCYDGQPYCRCNNRNGEFYIDDKCSQRWTLVTFALVASLPGLTLAVLVGVIVYVVVLSATKKRSGKNITQPRTAAPKEEDLFPGIAFASDMNGRPPPMIRPGQQDRVPMTTMLNRPYSVPSSDRLAEDPYSRSGGFRELPMGGPARLHSNPAGRDQVISNPYARDLGRRNPYDDPEPSSDHRNDYRRPGAPNPYEDLNQIQPYSPAPQYGAPDRGGNPLGGFPRPQLSLRY